MSSENPDVTPPPPDLPKVPVVPPPPSMSAPPPPPPPPPGMVAPMKRVDPAGPASAGDEDEDPLPEDGQEVSFQPRMMAAIIDLFVVLFLTVGLNILLPSVLEALSQIVAFAYLLTKDSLPFLQGQSIGKRVMKLRAVTVDGKPLTGQWAPGILRNVFWVISPIELVILWSKYSNGKPMRRIGDEVAKTKVIADRGGDPSTD